MSKIFIFKVLELESAHTECSVVTSTQHLELKTNSLLTKCFLNLWGQGEHLTLRYSNLLRIPNGEENKKAKKAD